MLGSLYTTITINNEDVDVLVKYIVNTGLRESIGDVFIELISVTLDGVEIETTTEQDEAILQECFENVEEDYEEERASYGDYRYEMSRELEI